MRLRETANGSLVTLSLLLLAIACMTGICRAGDSPFAHEEATFDVARSQAFFQNTFQSTPQKDFLIGKAAHDNGLIKRKPSKTMQQQVVDYLANYLQYPGGKFICETMIHCLDLFEYSREATTYGGKNFYLAGMEFSSSRRGVIQSVLYYHF